MRFLCLISMASRWSNSLSGFINLSGLMDICVDSRKKVVIACLDFPPANQGGRFAFPPPGGVFLYTFAICFSRDDLAMLPEDSAAELRGSFEVSRTCLSTCEYV